MFKIQPEAFLTVQENSFFGEKSWKNQIFWKPLLLQSGSIWHSVTFVKKKIFSTIKKAPDFEHVKWGKKSLSLTLFVYIYITYVGSTF